MDKPIRILHCIVNMNRGGAETLVMNIYRNIDRSKVQFDFLTSAPGAFDNEIEKLGGKIYRIPYITKTGPLKYSKSIRNFLLEHKEYKIIHSHMDRMSGLIMREAKKAGVPVRIAHSHSTKSEGNIIVRIIKKYYSLYLFNATDYFACSNDTAVFMFNQKNVTIINNGIDYNKFVFDNQVRNKLRNKYGLENSFVLGHIGRFSKPKNHKFLLNIFKEVSNINPDSHLILVGSGSLEKNIKNSAEKLEISDKIIFLGDRDDVNEILNLFDVFVFPSLFEGLGIVLIEAQASGLKCFASDKVPKESDVTGNVEFISLKKTAKYWAKRIIGNNNYNRKNMSESIRNAGYDIEKTAKYLEDYYLNEYNKQTRINNFYSDL